MHKSNISKWKCAAGVISLICNPNILHVYQSWSEVIQTCGGGSPPAPCGHSGSIRRTSSVLHWQSGEGASPLQLPLLNICQVEYEICGRMYKPPRSLSHWGLLQEGVNGNIWMTIRGHRWLDVSHPFWAFCKTLISLKMGSPVSPYSEAIKTCTMNDHENLLTLRVCV